MPLLCLPQVDLPRPDRSIPGYFGVSVDVDRDVAVVGADRYYFDSDLLHQFVGAVFVFRRTGATWSEEAVLRSSGAAHLGSFGAAVAIEGDTVVVGAPAEGAAYVFSRVAGVWVEAQRLTGVTGLGTAVAISGETAVIGAAEDGSAGSGRSGSVRIFTPSGSGWIEAEALFASDGSAGDGLGASVAISGDTIVVGAPGDDADHVDQGSTYVFARAGGRWSEQAHIVATDGAFEESGGARVALSGDNLLIGSARSTRRFVRDGIDWSDRGTLPPRAAGLAIEGDIAVVGTGSGDAYVYEVGAWTEEARYDTDLMVGGEYGRAVAISGDTVIVGANAHAYVFRCTTVAGPDAGSAPDVGASLDAGTVAADAGMLDAARSGLDVGESDVGGDARPADDAAVTSPSPTAACACRASSSDPGLPVAAVVLGASIVGRRRRRRR
ncbi:MAG: FG-GAP repeat protein [Deltaproteobacteria bacterium]|nr:FG-GAP repeat protein [Deltaproteobacteria bacterium]